ncbi:uncharacterized protein C8R40DRAFT_1060569, partial [Lentinula edodes]|uniref:uncharacterized protein n=1 Tax=Lentinula edodes TaxID=5353 RepID=UPI001E8CA132
MFVLDSSKNRKVPVPIGPAIPRRDRENDWPRYCRLMLMFFKPWRNAVDLRERHESWADAFAIFNQNCPDNVKKMMNNMQILHECRDSRDD